MLSFWLKWREPALGNPPVSPSSRAGYPAGELSGPCHDTVTGIVARFDGGTGKDALDGWKCAQQAKLNGVERKKLSSRCPTP